MSSNMAIMYFKEMAIPVEEGLGTVKHGHYLLYKEAAVPVEEGLGTIKHGHYTVLIF